MRKIYRKGVFVAVYSLERAEIKYLLLKRKLHWKGWEFPKGGIEKSEKILNAIKREVKEETGLKILKIKRFKVSGKYNYSKVLSDRKGFAGQTYILFAVQVKKSKIKIDKIEHSDYKWLSFEEAVKKLTWKNQRKCLRIVNKLVNGKP